jgi:hypothetical protein
MNWFGMPIKAEKCSDCITVAGQAYCTMNCGPCVPLKETTHATREDEKPVLHRPNALRRG